MSNFVILSNFENSKLGWHCVATLLKLRSAADIPSLASALSEGESSHLLLKLLMIFHHFFHHFLEIFRDCMAYCRKNCQKAVPVALRTTPSRTGRWIGPNRLGCLMDWNRKNRGFPWFSIVQVEKLISTGWKFSASPWFFVAVSPGVPLFCLSHSANYARGLRPTLRRNHEVMKSWSFQICLRAISCQAIARDGSFICAQGYVPWPRSLFWGVKRQNF